MRVPALPLYAQWNVWMLVPAIGHCFHVSKKQSSVLASAWFSGDLHGVPFPHDSFMEYNWIHHWNSCLATKYGQFRLHMLHTRNLHYGNPRKLQDISTVLGFHHPQIFPKFQSLQILSPSIPGATRLERSCSHLILPPVNPQNLFYYLITGKYLYAP